MVSYGGGNPDASKLSLQAVPFPIEMINNITLALSPGFLICALVRPNGGQITNLGLMLGTAGITPNGVNNMGLFDSSGNQLGLTGDLSTSWSTGGNNGLYLESAITGGPIGVSSAADYYITVLSHMVTPPNIGGFFAGPRPAYPSLK